MNPCIKALRLPFLAGSLMPIVIGSAFAFSARCFSFALFLICIVGITGLHLGANLINDYFDARGSDPLNVRVTPFSGGSRVIQEGELTPGSVLLMAILFFALALACGIILVGMGKPLVMVIGLSGLGAGWAYSAPPFQLMSRGWGEALIFLAFGPLITLGTFYVMSGDLSWPAFTLGAPQGFFITGVIWINQFPDYEADQSANKKNLVVRMGPALARYPYCLIIIGAFAMVVVLVGVVELPYTIMLSLFALPPAFKAIKIMWREYLSHEGLIPAQALTVQTLVVHGLLLSLGLVLGRFI